MTKCKLDSEAECEAKEVNMDMCLACIASGNFGLLAILAERLREATMKFSTAVSVVSILKALAESVNREMRWLEEYRPAYWAEQKKMFDELTKERQADMKRMMDSLGGKKADIYRA